MCYHKEMMITIDTNVVFQALTSKRGASYQIFQLIRAGNFRLALSQATFDEYQEVLLRSGSLNPFGITDDDASALLRFIAFISENYNPFFLFRPNLADESDNKFIELALTSNSKCLITNNTKDFVSGELLFNNFELIKPAEFMRKWRSIA